MSELTKRQAEALGRIFEREVSGALSALNWPCYPASLPGRMAKQLFPRGFVRYVEFSARGVGRSVMDQVQQDITGYVLTHAGRMAYCEWASQQPTSEGAVEPAPASAPPGDGQ